MEYRSVQFVARTEIVLRRWRDCVFVEEIDPVILSARVSFRPELERLAQETFQRRAFARSQETGLHTAPPQNLPLQVDHIGNEHFIDSLMGAV